MRRKDRKAYRQGVEDLGAHPDPAPAGTASGAGSAGGQVTYREQRLAEVRALIAAAEPALTLGSADREIRLGQLCRAAASTLPALGAAVTVMTAEGVQSVAVASDPRALGFEELQSSSGEGPCVDAFERRRPVLAPDLDRESVRWPAYAPASLDLGVRAVFAFPLQIGAARLGVLDIYRGEPGALSAAAVREALTFAELALQILLDGQEAATDQPVEGLEAAVESRAGLFQAQGMVMIQLGVSLAAAMSRLRAHAFAHDRRLADVARDVVARRLKLEPDRTPDGPD
jgi:hypothetical protein